MYYAKDETALAEGIEIARGRLAKLEEALARERDNDGPYFNGSELCLVDAAYAPFLRRYAFVEPRLGCGLLKEFPLVQAWSDALAADERITGSVADTFEHEFIASLHRRGAMAAVRSGAGGGRLNRHSARAVALAAGPGGDEGFGHREPEPRRAGGAVPAVACASRTLEPRILERCPGYRSAPARADSM